jgi:hypothetical protein
MEYQVGDIVKIKKPYQTEAKIFHIYKNYEGTLSYDLEINGNRICSVKRKHIIKKVV